MELIYIFHSGFALLGDGYTLIMDYFRDTEEGTVQKVLSERDPCTTRGFVLASHFHPDHFNKEVLEWKAQYPDLVYVFSKDILRHRRAHKEDAVWLKKGEVYADDTLSIRAFGSTDVGVSFLIETEGKKIFHAGDLNNWHWMDESTETEWKGAEKNFLHELNDLYAYTREVDVAMFPVDPRLGKEYMRGPKQFVEKIKTNIFVPMHFEPEYEKANAFRSIAEANGAHFVELTHPGQRIKI